MKICKRLVSIAVALMLLLTACTAQPTMDESGGQESTSATQQGDSLSTSSTSKPTSTSTTPPVRTDGVFTDDIFADDVTPSKSSKPIKGAVGSVNPLNDARAIALGEQCAAEIDENQIADFEKNIAYCERNGGSTDKMVHVSTFTVIGDTVYMTYYANTGSAAEDPKYQEARLAYCSLNDPTNMKILTVQKVGATVGDETITRVYDTILMQKNNNEIYVMWTASTIVQYYRFYRVFNVQTKKLGPVKVNRFKAGNVTNDFSVSGVKHALYAANVSFKPLSSDIGIMQKTSTRVEGGVTYYYTGAYAGAFNCIIKSRDLITWEYVATPSFDNQSEFENSVYVLGNKVYYFVRQETSCAQGFLTSYDLVSKKWASPVLIKDAQSRSDFIYYKNRLYLIHAPKNRNGFGITYIDQNNLAASKAVAVVDMESSCFYPFVKVYGNEAYISYTVDRQHIRLSKFNLDLYV